MKVEDLQGGRAEAAGSSTTSTSNWQKRRPFLPRSPRIEAEAIEALFLFSKSRQKVLIYVSLKISHQNGICLKRMAPTTRDDLE